MLYIGKPRTWIVDVKMIDITNKGILYHWILKCDQGLKDRKAQHVATFEQQHFHNATSRHGRLGPSTKKKLKNLLGVLPGFCNTHIDFHLKLQFFQEWVVEIGFELGVGEVLQHQLSIFYV